MSVSDRHADRAVRRRAGRLVRLSDSRSWLPGLARLLRSPDGGPGARACGAREPGISDRPTRGTQGAQGDAAPLSRRGARTVDPRDRRLRLGEQADAAQPTRLPLVRVLVVVTGSARQWTVTLLLKPLFVVAHLIGGSHDDGAPVVAIAAGGVADRAAGAVGCAGGLLTALGNSRCRSRLAAG